MDKFPAEIQTQFFKLFNGELPVENFEQWVYRTRELELFFTHNDYLDVISLDFKSPHLIHELKKIAVTYLDHGEFEKRKIEKILNDLVSKNDNFASSLIATYDMYCHGYGFMDNLGLGYGLTFDVDFYDFANWTSLSPEEKTSRIDAIYEGVKAEAEKVRGWLESGKLILTGEVSESQRFKYVDNRTAEEKKPTAYSVERRDGDDCVD